MDKLLAEYASVSSDLEFAYQFVNLEAARDFIPRVAFRQVSEDVKYIKEYLKVDKKAPDLLYATLMETLKPSLRQFVSSEHKMLVDEVTQLGLIESCLLKMSQIRGALG